VRSRTGCYGSSSFSQCWLLASSAGVDFCLSRGIPCRNTWTQPLSCRDQSPLRTHAQPQRLALMQRGAANRVAISVPRESYWGEEIPPIARPYLEKRYGADLAGRVDFCTTDPDLTSAQQEAQALSTCIQEHGWKTVALLTSNYQSRRVGVVWRKTLLKGDRSVNVWVQSVPDPGYQPRGWWRQRLYAETWLRESAKLAWASL
jgi:hypothetical protein